MPTTRINPQQAVVAGGTVTFAAADTTNGNNYVPSPGRLVLLQNTSGSPVTVTFVTPGTRSGLAIADDPVVVAATSIAAVSIQDATDFQSSAGQVDFTAAAALNVAVLQA